LKWWENLKSNLLSVCLIIGITFLLIPYPIMAQTTNKDTLVIGIDELDFIDIRAQFNEGDFPTFDLTSVLVQYMASLGTFAPGDVSDVLPAVAKNWTHNENLTEWTYTLREGLTFHDGTPIDAKAVEYSLYAREVATSFSPYATYGGPVNFSYVKAQYYLGYEGGINISFPEEDPTGSGRIIIFQFENLIIAKDILKHKDESPDRIKEI
jgi:ABC-type transport system substrate-binding protein